VLKSEKHNIAMVFKIIG